MKTLEVVYQKLVDGRWITVGKGTREVEDRVDLTWHLSTAYCCNRCATVFLKKVVEQTSYYIQYAVCPSCEAGRFPIGSLLRLTNHWFPFTAGITLTHEAPREVLIDELLYQQGVVDHVQHYTDSRIAANTNPFADRFISADPDRSASNY